MYIYIEIFTININIYIRSYTSIYVCHSIMKSYYFPSVIAILRSITLIDMDDGLAISTNLCDISCAELHWKILSARTMLYTDAKHESRKKAIAREEIESTNRIINVHTFR